MNVRVIYYYRGWVCQMNNQFVSYTKHDDTLGPMKLKGESAVHAILPSYMMVVLSHIKSIPPLFIFLFCFVFVFFFSFWLFSLKLLEISKNNSA